MTQVASLAGHSQRVLYLSLSPNGEDIVTGGGDETLRIWNVFSKPKVRPQKVSAQFIQWEKIFSSGSHFLR
jgi:cell division cycle 20-like protein 1 (cofactor of APC complex)